MDASLTVYSVWIQPAEVIMMFLMHAGHHGGRMLTLLTNTLLTLSLQKYQKLLLDYK